MIRDKAFADNCPKPPGLKLAADPESNRNSVQKELVVWYLREKFGNSAVRLFNILHTKSTLEEKAITKISMLSSKESRQVLFALFKGGFIQLQEVPKVPDHAPSRTIFLWKYDFKRAVKTLELIFLKSIVNLQARLTMPNQPEVENFLQSEILKLTQQIAIFTE